MSVQSNFVDCFRGGKLLKTYDYGAVVGLVPGTPESNDKLKDSAKTDLTNDGLAFPPYDGIEFLIRRSYA